MIPSVSVFLRILQAATHPLPLLLQPIRFPSRKHPWHSKHPRTGWAGSYAPGAKALPEPPKHTALATMGCNAAGDSRQSLQFFSPKSTESDSCCLENLFDVYPEFTQLISGGLDLKAPPTQKMIMSKISQPTVPTCIHCRFGSRQLHLCAAQLGRKARQLLTTAMEGNRDPAALVQGILLSRVRHQAQKVKICCLCSVS